MRLAETNFFFRSRALSELSSQTRALLWKLSNGISHVCHADQFSNGFAKLTSAKRHHNWIW